MGKVLMHVMARLIDWVFRRFLKMEVLAISQQDMN